MEWLLGIFACFGAIAALITVGEHLDKWMDANPAAKHRLAQLLRQGTSTGLSHWLQGINQGFLNLFDRVYGGRGTRLERAVWMGLVSSPWLLILRQTVVQAIAGVRDSTSHGRNDLLLLSLAGVALFSLLGLAILLLSGSRRPPDLRTLVRYTAFRVNVSLVGLMTLGILSYVAFTIFNVGSNITSDLILYSVSMVVSFVGFSISFATLHDSVKILIHPIKALVFSLFSICLVGLIEREAGWAFVNAITSDPQGNRILFSSSFGQYPFKVLQGGEESSDETNCPANDW